MRRVKLMLILLVLLAVIAGIGGPRDALAQGGGRVSEFGRYEGYSEVLYHDYVRTSQYVAVRDGTRLAVDIYRPAVNGTPVEEPLPVIWTHTRYQRAQQLASGQVYEGLGSGLFLLLHGYVIAIVDVRGSGASFGVRTSDFSREEAQDAYDITEWLAAQPWCDGNVGMSGRSYLGITQLFAAAEAPPHLRAIFPEMHMFDIYDLVYQNGIYMRDFLENWDQITQHLDNSTLMPVAPVDEDPDGALLAQALALRPQNGYPLALTQAAPYRDSPTAAGASYADMSPSTYVDALNASGVAVYQLGGWFDMYATDPLLWFVNLDVPNKLVMPAWNHTSSANWLAVEKLRWFDYWLKGIDNGIMDEPPLRYYVMGAEEWRTAEQWPLPNEQRTAFYFQAGPSGSVGSVNDGLLGTDAPSDAAAWDEYTVDTTTTVGPANRYAAGRGGAFGYPDMTANDEHALTYTTPPLEADVEVTGHPVVHLWVTSTAADGDFFVYLEEVDASGRSTYITEGKIRASHRALAEPPWDNIGLPWHRSDAEDIEPLPAGVPVELIFDLKPTANLFEVGSRIRITITGADADTFETPRLVPLPTVSLYRDAAHPSYVELPVIPAE